MAVFWRQAIAEAVQSAVAAKQQVVEPDHLAKALLEQPNGLARRIIVKVRAFGINYALLCSYSLDSLLKQPTQPTAALPIDPPQHHPMHIMWPA